MGTIYQYKKLAKNYNCHKRRLTVTESERSFQKKDPVKNMRLNYKNLKNTEIQK